MQACRILNGNVISESVLSELKQEVAGLVAATGRRPGLAVILATDRPDSASYVKKKREACERVGIHSFHYKLPPSSRQQDVLEIINDLNKNKDCHGILVQLPLPKHMDQNFVLDSIQANKDVDGFHPFNLGELAIVSRQPKFAACTPTGCMELLRRAGVKVEGKHAVVVGRSQIVGLPMALLLERANATVTIAHSKTHDLGAIVRQGDIIVAASGQALMIKGEWIKPGAAVIDVGVNFIKDPTKKSGLRMVGDVEFETARLRAGVITPVPGGVGPMTIACLMRNCVQSFKYAMKEEEGRNH